MSEAVRELVDRRWSEYGFEGAAQALDGSRGSVRRLLRR